MLDDLETLARTIFGEGRGEPFDGQVAIAWVIRNRSEQRHESIKDVCLKPKQFSCWNVDDPNREKMLTASMSDPAFMRAYGIAILVMTRDLGDPTNGANHYHTNTIHPYWATGMTTTYVIGRHKFLRA